MAQKRFSKDPKVKLISIKEFFEKTDYLFEAKKQLLKKIQGQALACIIKLLLDSLFQFIILLRLSILGRTSLKSWIALRSHIEMVKLNMNYLICG